MQTNINDSNDSESYKPDLEDALNEVKRKADIYSSECFKNVFKAFDHRSERLIKYHQNPSQQHVLNQQIELARTIKITNNEILGDTGPLLTKHEGYRSNATLYDEIYDFYQVPIVTSLFKEMENENSTLLNSNGISNGTNPLNQKIKEVEASFQNKQGGMKKFASRNRWLPRYYLLEGRYLRYYNSKKHCEAYLNIADQSKEKGFYDIGQAICEPVDDNEFLLRFLNGDIKRMRAPSRESAKEWISILQQRSQHFSNKDNSRVLFQGAMIQSLNILLKSKDLTRIAHESQQKEIAALTKKLKSLEDLLWASHKQQINHMTNMHQKKMDALREMERNLLNDTIASLSSKLGTKAETDTFQTKLDEIQEEKNIKAAMDAMLRSKLLREVL